MDKERKESLQDSVAESQRTRVAAIEKDCSQEATRVMHDTHDRDPRRDKEIILYFDSRDSYSRANRYLTKVGVNTIPLGFGGLRGPVFIKDILKGAGFAFHVAENYETFWSNMSHRENYLQQVRSFIHKANG